MPEWEPSIGMFSGRILLNWEKESSDFISKYVTGYPMHPYVQEHEIPVRNIQ